MLRTLFFVRHGQTEWNRIRRMQGQWNSDLDERGRAQAEGHGRLLARLAPDAIYCSPLDRTRQTAEAITRHIPLEVTYDPRIMEWDSGDWSGHMYADLPEKWPEAWAAWRVDPYFTRAPGGENYPDMATRARPFLDEVLSSPHSRIAIVSHGMIGKTMIALLAKLSPAAVLAIHQRNDTVFQLTMDGDTVANIQHYVGQAGPFDGLSAPESTLGPA